MHSRKSDAKTANRHFKIAIGNVGTISKQIGKAHKMSTFRERRAPPFEQIIKKPQFCRLSKTYSSFCTFRIFDISSDRLGVKSFRSAKFAHKKIGKITDLNDFTPKRSDKISKIRNVQNEE